VTDGAGDDDLIQKYRQRCRQKSIQQSLSRRRVPSPHADGDRARWPTRWFVVRWGL